jgi:hypothetical protein
MSLTLNLPPDTERKLYQRASQAGETIERLALKFIEGTERASVRIQKGVTHSPLRGEGV